MKYIDYIDTVYRFYNDILKNKELFKKSISAVLTINFGNLLKIWNVDNKVKTLSVKEKNCLLAQQVKLKLHEEWTEQYKTKSIDTQSWERLSFHMENKDEFFCEKLIGKIGEEAYKLIVSLFEHVYNIISQEEATFYTFTQQVKIYCDQHAAERSTLLSAAAKIETLACIYTKEYFLYRYLARAILSQNISDPSIYEKEYTEEKKVYGGLSSYIKFLKHSVKHHIDPATLKFNSEHKCITSVLNKLEIVSNNSGLIAITYVGLASIVVYLRYLVIEKESPAYELCALPSTILAMAQISASFPSLLYSKVQTQGINNNIFDKYDLKNNNNIRIADIQFLLENTPCFSNSNVSTIATCFRGAGNLLLQPIDLVQNYTKDIILKYTALCWFIPCGVIEEQAKVGNFAHSKLEQYLYRNIVPTLINNNHKNTEHIDPFFRLLYQYIGEDETKKQKLKEIYYKCNPTGNINFENITEYKYDIWQKVTYTVTVASFALEYLCAYARNETLNFYEDPVWYLRTVAKFMRLGSLVTSKWYANKMIHEMTGEQLLDDILFQNFYYNDAARLIAAIIPLIIFESTKDIRVLTMATVLDVLSTVKSDTQAGEAISTVNKVNTEELAIALDFILKVPIEETDNHLLGENNV